MTEPIISLMGWEIVLKDLEAALETEFLHFLALREGGDHHIIRIEKYIPQNVFKAILDMVREQGGKYDSYSRSFVIPISRKADRPSDKAPIPEEETMELESLLGLTGREWQHLTVRKAPEEGYLINPRYPPLDQDLESRLLDRVNELGGRWTPEGYLIPRSPKPLTTKKGVEEPPSTPKAEGFDVQAERLIAGEIQYGELERIRPNNYNPNEMSDEEFEALVANMREEGPHGTDPLLVRPLDGLELEIIDGLHRWKAAGILGWRKIRYEVRDVDEDRAKEINYAKNKLRGRINPFKEAELFFATWQKAGKLEEVADKFGVSISYASRTVGLRRIPDKVRKIMPRGINRSLLEVLATIDDAADQEKLAAKIRDGCTVREAQKFANSLKIETPSGSPLETPEQPEPGIETQPPGEQPTPSPPPPRGVTAATPSTTPTTPTTVPTETPTKVPLKEEKVSKPEPVDTGVMFTCPECGKRLMIIHVTPDRHRFQEVKG